MIVAKSGNLPPEGTDLRGQRRGLILGGPSVMRQSRLAQQGFECALVETEKGLGNFLKIYISEGNAVRIS
jgi:hypothetical protein